MRPEHPLAARRLELRDLADLRFISTSIMLGRENDMDALLREHGLGERKFAMFVTALSQAPLAMRHSDAVITVPMRVGKLLAAQFDLCLCELPKEIPERTYSIAWHSRWDDSQAHRWLREAVMSILRDDEGMSGI